MDTTIPAHELDAVRLLKKKDKAAIPLIYKHYSNALYGIVIRMVGRQEVAEEVLQEAFVKIWKYGDKYDGDKARLFTWMSQIARNVAISAMRSKKFKESSKTDSLDTDVYTNDRAFSEEQQVNHIGLKKVIDELDERQRILIEYVYFRGYSHSEVAKELDIPIGTVKSRLRAAILTLRKSLGKDLDVAAIITLITLMGDRIF